MASIWDNIGVKAIPGVTPVTNDQKNDIISSAVTQWTGMGLTQEQIAFGIATMGVESAFNSTALSTDPRSTEYGLGQFNNPTWNRAVNYYNQNYGGNLDPAVSREDVAAQIAVMGAWIPVVQSRAADVLNDPRLGGYSQNQIAYGMWHEGFGTIGNVPEVQRFLDHVKGFNNANVGGYFDATLEKARRGREKGVRNLSRA